MTRSPVLLLLFVLSLSIAAPGDAADSKEPAAPTIGDAVVDATSHRQDTAASTSGVTITDDGWQVSDRSPTERYRSRLFHINSGGPLRYDLSLPVHQKKDAAGEWKTVGALVGIPAPSACNWYHSSFFLIEANGQSIQNQAPQVEVVETGARGIVDFTWDHPLLTVRTRFIMDAGADFILMELRWTPKAGLKKLRVNFYSYPQGFAVAQEDKLNGLALHRRIQTAARAIDQVRKVDLDPAEESWLFYQDVTLDKTRRGNSFCSPGAMLVLPEDFTAASGNGAKIHLDVGNYCVITAMDLNPAGGRLRLALWDSFGDLSADRAKAEFITQVPAVRERMAKGSWLPTAVEGLDAKAEQARVDDLARKLGPKADARLNALRQQLGQLTAQQAALASGAGSFQAERELTVALTRYCILAWQVERPVRKETHVLLLAGPTAYAWHVEDIVRKRWGDNALRRGCYTWKSWIGHRVSYFPGTLAELYGYDVVVLADFPRNPLSPDQQQWLADFVTNGGGLLMLGGYYAYGEGDWGQSPLSPLLPVQVGVPFDLRPVTGDVRLQPANIGGTILAPGKPLPAADLGCVYWRHDLKLKDGAAVWLTAGGEPFAVAGRAGEGRVIAILGTALGEAPNGQTAFWDAGGWGPLLEQLLDYLAG